MQLVRILGYAFGVLVLVGGWSFIYWQSSSGELAAADGARTSLAELRAVDAGWNQRLIAARLLAGETRALSGTASSPSVAAPRSLSDASRHRKAYAALESRVLGLRIPGAGLELAKLKRAFDDKESVLTRLADVTSARSEAQRADPLDLTKIAEISAVAEALFDQAWLASTEPRLGVLGRSIDQASDRALSEAELYRVGLLFYSGFLLAVLAYLVLSLAQRGRQIDRINLQLRDANESLEVRVVERTRELSATLAKLKESEAMLIQSEKMSSLGQMVAGIAHEVNTPLAYVKSSLEAVAKSVPAAGMLAMQTRRLLGLLSAEDVSEAALAAQFALVQAQIDELGEKAGGRSTFEELRQLVKDGLFGIEQISEVVSNLKNFSRLDRSKVADYDLHEGIDSAIRIGHSQLEKRIVEKKYGAIPPVSCSPSQINQVILNLLSNAAQATSEGAGKITVSTAMRDAENVVLEVADNGGGIPADVLPKIFDPFFTTKEVGKGTGLGLSICYKIVESHGGRLEVQSTPGLGTRFSVILPIKSPAGEAA